MDQQMLDLELKIKNKKYQRIADKAHDTHSYFISKENEEAALRARRLKKRQLQQIIEKNSKAVGKPLLKKGQKEEDTESNSSLISIPESPLLSQIQQERAEYIKKLGEKQDEIRRQIAVRTVARQSRLRAQSQAAHVKTGGLSGNKTFFTPIVAQRFY
jgi:hypothetical protein